MVYTNTSDHLSSFINIGVIKTPKVKAPSGAADF